MELRKIKNLLVEFERLPKPINEATYLEICKYPRSRFEEISSRVLCFFFLPKNEHGFRDLFLSSILELLSSKTISFRADQIKVINEENADGKRLDILIYSPNFVIGIENKITAPVNNPLGIYKKKIEQYGNINVFKVILSLNKNFSENELLIIERNDFKVITYSMLFEIIKRNVGQYISQGNQKYLIYLFDFIQTLENMKDENTLNNELSNFFFDNSESLDSLINLYNKRNERIIDIQKSRISELKEKISKETNNTDWWAWEGWDLGFNSFNPNKPEIGIESYFDELKNNPLGEFRIFITTWNQKNWTHYEKQIRERYPDKFLKRENNKMQLHMDTLDGENEELILKNLKTYFEFLKGLTED